MELGGKLLNSLRIKTQFFERLLQSVGVVDGAAYTQKDDVKSNGDSLENVVKVFVLFLCGVQLVQRSSVLTVLDLDEVDVTPRQKITVVCGSGIGEVLAYRIVVPFCLVGSPLQVAL